jgi:hypothetical protein
LSPDNITEIPGRESSSRGHFSKRDLLQGGRALCSHSTHRTGGAEDHWSGQRASLSALLEPGKRAVTVRVDDVRGSLASFCRAISSTWC